MNTKKYIKNNLSELGNIPKIISNIEKADIMPEEKTMLIRFYRAKKKDIINEIEMLTELS